MTVIHIPINQDSEMPKELFCIKFFLEHAIFNLNQII